MVRKTRLTALTSRLKFGSGTSYSTDWHYMIDPLFFTANMKVWKEFSPEDQKLILSCATEAENTAKPFPV